MPSDNVVFPALGMPTMWIFTGGIVPGGVRHLCKLVRHLCELLSGAGEGNRTPDLLLTMEALCRLSYSGEIGDA